MKAKISPTKLAEKIKILEDFGVTYTAIEKTLDLTRGNIYNWLREDRPGQMPMYLYEDLLKKYEKLFAASEMNDQMDVLKKKNEELQKINHTFSLLVVDRYDIVEYKNTEIKTLREKISQLENEKIALEKQLDNL